jgi:hypothetical protein
MEHLSFLTILEKINEKGLKLDPKTMIPVRGGRRLNINGVFFFLPNGQTSLFPKPKYKNKYEYKSVSDKISESALKAYKKKNLFSKITEKFGLVQILNLKYMSRFGLSTVLKNCHSKKIKSDIQKIKPFLTKNLFKNKYKLQQRKRLYRIIKKIASLKKVRSPLIKAKTKYNSRLIKTKTKKLALFKPISEFNSFERYKIIQMNYNKSYTKHSKKIGVILPIKKIK